MLLDEMDELD
jgi:serine/threonine-protein phosphatase 2A regulatory subunit A